MIADLQRASRPFGLLGSPPAGFRLARLSFEVVLANSVGGAAFPG
jgi:hypothetical protein